MTVDEFIKQAQIGYVVQITWNGPLFDPDLILKPGDKAFGLSKVFTCGFVALVNKDYVCIGIDAMFEGANTEPSFRSVVTIPVSTITNAEIYGKVAN